MYDSAQILHANGLYTRVGMKEPTKTGYTGILDATAKLTKSGKTYDFYHTLANFVNIKDCQEDVDILAAEINALIATWQKDAIESGLSHVFEGRPDLLENALLYKYANRYSDLVINNGKFVGFEIEVPTTDKIVNVLNSAILQFNDAKVFNLYLFHSSVKTAIATIPATSVKDTFAKVTLGKYLYAQSATYGPGKFYLGYFQGDLGTVQAYDRIWDNANIQTRYKCLGIRSIQVTPNGTSLFDIDDVEYTSESWGLNLDISSYNDYTNLILNNQSLFDAVQGYMFAIRVLELIKTTGRINPTQRVNANLPDIAAFDLETQTGENVVKNTGLYTKLKIEINRVRKSLFDDSSIIVQTA